MDTLKVYDLRFNGELMIINAADFDPAVHRREEDGPWGKGVSRPVPGADDEDLPEVSDAPAPAKRSRK